MPWLGGPIFGGQNGTAWDRMSGFEGPDERFSGQYSLGMRLNISKGTSIREVVYLLEKVNISLGRLNSIRFDI